jgi:nitrogen regulatory protein P-II 1
MKLIASLVRPDRIVDIKLALERLNVFEIAVAQTHDYAPQNHGTTIWRGHEYSYSSSLKMELRVVVQDDDVDEVVGAIMRAAKTGRVGDGHVCVLPVEHRYDIFTGRREVS